MAHKVTGAAGAPLLVPPLMDNRGRPNAHIILTHRRLTGTAGEIWPLIIDTLRCRTCRRWLLCHPQCVRHARDLQLKAVVIQALAACHMLPTKTGSYCGRDEKRFETCECGPTPVPDRLAACLIVRPSAAFSVPSPTLRSGDPAWLAGFLLMLARLPCQTDHRHDDNDQAPYRERQHTH